MFFLALRLLTFFWPFRDYIWVFLESSRLAPDEEMSIRAKDEQKWENMPAYPFLIFGARYRYFENHLAWRPMKK